MLNFKRFGRLIACVLVLCAAFSMLPRPVHALPGDLPVSGTTAGTTASFVHYSASYGATIIGCLENGTKLTVIGETRDFYRIDCYDMTGYIAKTQVEITEDGKHIVSCIPGSEETTTLSRFTTQESLHTKSEIRSFSQQYIGVPYVSGGTTPLGLRLLRLYPVCVQQPGLQHPPHRSFPAAGRCDHRQGRSAVR